MILLKEREPYTYDNSYWHGCTQLLLVHFRCIKQYSYQNNICYKAMLKLHKQTEQAM